MIVHGQAAELILQGHQTMESYQNYFKIREQYTNMALLGQKEGEQLGFFLMRWIAVTEYLSIQPI